MQKQLLIIADHWEALEVYENWLAPHFRVRVAAFGSEGIRMAREEQPDRIILDLVFEDMTAAEACQKLRFQQETRFIPLTVILSQDEKPLESPGVFPLPRDQVIRRPYPLSDLLERLKS